MILYIAGPMTAYPEWNYPAFGSAAAKLRAAGYTVTNPAESGEDTSLPWEYHLKIALRSLLDCDGVATLSHWEDSKGARLEVQVAHQLGMPIRPASSWLGGKE